MNLHLGKKFNEAIKYKIIRDSVTGRTSIN